WPSSSAPPSPAAGARPGWSGGRAIRSPASAPALPVAVMVQVGLNPGRDRRRLFSTPAEKLLVLHVPDLIFHPYAIHKRFKGGCDKPGPRSRVGRLIVLWILRFIVEKIAPAGDDAVAAAGVNEQVPEETGLRVAVKMDVSALAGRV